MSIISFQNVSFHFRKKRKILDHVSFEVEKGELVGIVGPSGEGKTTLLKLINNTLFSDGKKTYEGEILINNENIKSFKNLNRFIGTVYQNPDNQIIFTNVVDELVFGMENHNYPKEVMEVELEKVLKQLKIQHLRNRNPNNLSGGEKQLVVLGSLLTLNVPVLLLDEAFAAVDKDHEYEIMNALKILKEKGMTIIMVEHDYSHLQLADKIFHLKDGKLEEVGVK